MKKVNEMNGTEKIAWKNIKNIFNYDVGGWYNDLQDGNEEYIPDSIEVAKNLVYGDAMNDYSKYSGHYAVGRAPREMRFAGSEFIRECIDYLFQNDGDVEEIAEAKNWN